MANGEQSEYWNGKAGERWAQMQAQIDRMMAMITAAVIPFAGVKPGERVLDVGCGCGTTTKLLAEAAGPAGGVTGVDISRPMLEFARQRGINANFLEADASEHRFKPTHDLVFSRFGVMFFDQPVAAFANIHTAVKPGGRMRFVCWQSASQNVWATKPLDIARPLLGPQEPSDPHAPGPFAFADGQRLAGILGEAGFRQVELSALETVCYLGEDGPAAARQAMTIGPLARAAAEADAQLRAQILDAVGVALAAHESPEGVFLPAACWLVAASA